MIFLRHPPVQVAPGTCYGRLDLACGPGAGGEIAALLRILPPATAVRSSPARRCMALAGAIAARDGLAPLAEPRLHELDFGAWEGRPWSAIDRAESDAWAADPMRVAPPGGETFAALLDRVAAALAETPPGAVVVTHAGVIRAARVLLAGAAFAEVFAEPVPHCTPLRIGPVLTEERLESRHAPQ